MNDTQDTEVRVNIEYCGNCGHLKQFIEMAEQIKKAIPDAQISGISGRQGSFEVQVNETLVYSKLQTMAFPDFEEVADVVKNASIGKPITQVKKQQPLTNCTVS